MCVYVLIKVLFSLSSIDIPILYSHASYHQGSIYCLAWNRNFVLASGSNDQTIRLLSFDREEGVPLDIPTVQNSKQLQSSKVTKDKFLLSHHTTPVPYYPRDRTGSFMYGTQLHSVP